MGQIALGFEPYLRTQVSPPARLLTFLDQELGAWMNRHYKPWPRLAWSYGPLSTRFDLA